MRVFTDIGDCHRHHFGVAHELVNNYRDAFFEPIIQKYFDNMLELYPEPMLTPKKRNEQ